MLDLSDHKHDAGSQVTLPAVLLIECRSEMKYDPIDFT
jgi:hypothetical protein